MLQLAFPGAREWIDSSPLPVEPPHGTVVLVDFWTFECYNCLNALRHVNPVRGDH